MMTIALLLWTLAVQTPTPNPACTVITAQEIASIIGAAKAMPVMSSAGGSSCQFQNGEKLFIVLIATPQTTESAQDAWTSKKRILGAEDLAGFSTPAFVSKKQGTLVGVVKGRTYVEARALDPSQPVDALSAKLQAVMKAVAARLQ